MRDYKHACKRSVLAFINLVSYIFTRASYMLYTNPAICAYMVFHSIVYLTPANPDSKNFVRLSDELCSMSRAMAGGMLARTCRQLGARTESSSRHSIRICAALSNTLLIIRDLQRVETH